MPLSPLAGPAGFLAWNWFYAYGILSSRTIKQVYGIDHNANPRQDLNKYGEASVKEGKMTRKQVERCQRFESASANSVEGYTLFAGSVLFALYGKVPIPEINKYCAYYTVARLAYGAIYIVVDDDKWASLRSLAWWTGNVLCLRMLWCGAQA